MTQVYLGHFCLWAHKDSVTVAKPRLTALQFALAKLPDPASAVRHFVPHIASGFRILVLTSIKQKSSK